MWTIPTFSGSASASAASSSSLKTRLRSTLVPDYYFKRRDLGWAVHEVQPEVRDVIVCPFA